LCVCVCVYIYIRNKVIILHLNAQDENWTEPKCRFISIHPFWQMWIVGSCLVASPLEFKCAERG